MILFRKSGDNFTEIVDVLYELMYCLKIHSRVDNRFQKISSLNTSKTQYLLIRINYGCRIRECIQITICLPDS